MFEPRKVGWSGLGSRGLCEGEGRGNCLKYLKRGVEQKRKEKKQRFLKEGGDALKRGTGTPLRTMRTFACSFGDLSV